MGKGLKSLFKKIAPIAAPVIGSAFGPAGAAAGGALGGAIGGGGLKGALIGGATSGIGGLAANALGASGPTLGSAIGQAGGGFSTSSNVLSSLAKIPISSLAGAANSIGDSFMSSPEPEGVPSTTEPTPFSPTRQAQLDLPGSLSGFSGLDESQLSSNIANQGVYGGGQGPQEEDFFTNLINRRLVDETGNVDQDLSEINPIESSYLSQLGLGGYTDPRSLLEAISKRKAQGAL